MATERTVTAEPSITQMGEGHLTQLPSELRYYIMEWVGIEDLVRLSQVSKKWMFLAGHPLFWKKLYERDKRKWKIFSNAGIPSSSLWDKVSKIPSFLTDSGNALRGMLASSLSISSPTSSRAAATTTTNTATSTQEQNWKALYLQQHRENNPKKMSTSPSSTSFAKRVGSSFSSKKVHRIPVFGDGLDTSAKKLLYNMMWTKGSPFSMTQLYAGVEGIGSGVGFVICGKELNLAALYRCEDRGVFEKIRPVWKEFFRTASGFVFVVDCSQSLEEVKHDFDTFLSDVHSTNNSPLLVLSCVAPPEDEDNPPVTAPAKTTDLASSDASNPLQSSSRRPHVTPVELATCLELTRITQRKWSIYHCTVANFEGVIEGLQWLSVNI
jgi:hypothetical protein